MSKEVRFDVVVVGAGPVGLTLATDLASRGATVCVVETRHYGEPPNVKCNHVAARTMEQFRRLGVAQRVRNAGLPADHPNDVVFRTRMTGVELTRIPIPSRRDRYTETNGPDGWWPTPEPPHRINQLFLEPILLDHAAGHARVTLMNRCRATEFEQDDDGVSVRAENIDDGAVSAIRCRYLVGCDGGSSMVRKSMGAKFEGNPVIQRVQSTYIRAPELLGRLPGKPAWSCYSVNAERCGTVFAIDGKETWLVHNHLNPHEPEFDSIDRHASIRAILGVEADFPYDVISKEDWIGRRLVADRFRNGRVFIAGDAAHLWVPYAGYGMNAGIADAVNLAWVLSARLQGWGGERMLDAYEAERLPITDQVSRFAMDHAAKMIKARQAVPANIEAPGSEGEASRASVGREAYELNVQQFCCAGLNFGYFYQGSPIIIGDGEAPPPYTMGSFVESTVPGCRAPHFWLRDGASLYDRLGLGYTLLRIDPRVPVAEFLSAAERRGVPFQLVELAGESLPSAYRHPLLVMRSDQHIAWRGDAFGDIDTLMEVFCAGAGGSTRA